MHTRTSPSSPSPSRGRRALRIATLTLGAGLLLSSLDAAAARLGGGRSSGLYRPQVTHTAPVSPAPLRSTQQTTAPQGAQQAARSADPRAAATAAAPRRNAWLGPLAGLAAGLGLGALAAHFGLAPAMGSWLLFALLGLAGFALVRMMLGAARARTAPLAAAAGTGSRQGVAPAGAWNSAWNGAAAAQPAAATAAAGFDEQAFVERARDVFLRLQQANDRSDLQALEDATTPELFEQFRRDLIQRGDARQSTEVLSLQAHMLEHVEHPLAQMASVRFSGLLREQPQQVGAAAFDEVWHFTRPRDGSSGWLLAGIQQTA